MDHPEDNKPTYQDLEETLRYILDNWENAWLRYVIRQSLKNKFDWRDQ